MTGLDIAQYTTFKLPSKVAQMLSFTGGNIEDFLNTIPKESSLFVLGGGSNIILPPEMTNVTVLKIENKGIEILSDDSESITLRIASGEIWDYVVAYTVQNNYSGIEALSAIPGTAGATPIQNVGAYGQEIKDVLVSVEAYDLELKKLVIIYKDECEFAYRMSKFKKDWKNRFIITHITLKLSKNAPTLPDYPGVKKYFLEHNINDLTLSQIRNAIIDIRWSKLPKPEEIPNCGSFFENPIVPIAVYKKIKLEFPDAPSFAINENLVKVPAGWLIENAGLKGANFGTVGTYEKSALVLINKGNATQADVISARDKIIETVFKKFGITLESEPEIIQ